MARYRYLIFLSIILASCAQVGTISGGEVDRFAPQPIADKVQPPNESVFFTDKSIEIPFDEFIRLNKPSENIIMVPPGAKIDASVKGKTLFLSWEEDLEPNTTYAIYLNNAVKDITESNDTLIQYVFSTGAIIDSLTYTTTVVDAWTNQPVAECVVGLFDIDSNKLVSFGKTDNRGVAILRYLSSESYRIVAFIDENFDLQVQDHEKVGFPENDVVELTSSMTDSIPIRLFSPKQKTRLRTVKYIAPGRIVLGANRDLKDAKIIVNNAPIDSDQIKEIKSDSLVVFINTEEINTLEVAVLSEEIKDTTKLRFTDAQKKRNFSISSKNSNNQFRPSEQISFFCNDFITQIDTSLIELMNLTDSSIIAPSSIHFEYDELIIDLNKDSLTDLYVLFKDSSITTTHAVSKKQGFTIQLLLDRKLGSINLDLSHYSSSIILQLIKNGKVIREDTIAKPSSEYLLQELFPGEYVFKVIQDRNGNQKWDVGDYSSKTQAENIDYYSTPIKVRANWDVEVKLGE
ncbi:MAG: Ig-like domain-containing protein [Fluviicola sp.]|nr:Ig-like domain-containing protein [Fluviicola sp.]